MDRLIDSQASRSVMDDLGKSLWLPVTMIALIALNFVGCGGSDSKILRMPIYGKVLGAEGQNGLVTFTPVDSAIGPAAVNDFKTGVYRFTKENGPVPGEYSVTIELEDSISEADMPKNLSGSKPPTLVYEAVEKIIAVTVPAKGPFEIDIDIRN